MLVARLKQPSSVVAQALLDDAYTGHAAVVAALPYEEHSGRDRA